MFNSVAFRAWRLAVGEGAEACDDRREIPLGESLTQMTSDKEKKKEAARTGE